MQPVFCYRAVVRSVYDADTIRADIDLGLSMWVHDEPLRLYGINAPEVRGTERPEGIVSRDWLRAQIPDGTEIVVETLRDRSGKFGRLLAVLWLGERNLNAEMVSLGLAAPYMVD